MTVLELINQALMLMGDKDQIESSQLNQEPTKSKAEILLKCVNLACKEIATEYIPIVKKQDIVIQNNEYGLSQLTNFYKVYKILQDEKSVQFFIQDEKIKLQSGEYQIVYSQNIASLTYTSTIPSFNGRVDDRVLSYCLIKEYYLLNGLFEEYKIYEQKFNKAMMAICYSPHNKIIKKRRWR